MLALFIPAVLPAANLTEADKNPVGKWKFSIPDAPYEYNTGYIEIKKEEDKFTGVMKFHDADFGFPCGDVKLEDDKISFGMFVDGMDVFITMNFAEDDKLSGTVYHPDGEVFISASRVVEDK
jgi:hypothetical protein